MKSILLCLSLLVFFPNDGEARDKSHALEAKRFLDYILAKDEKQLMTFTEHHERFFEGRKLNKDISEFLYAPKAGWKSITDIYKIDKMLLKIIKQKDNKIIVIYYPKKYHWQVNNSAKFLENEWMKKYFACAFTVRGEKLMLYQNFCFAETDGPFPPEY